MKHAGWPVLSDNADHFPAKPFQHWNTPQVPNVLTTVSAVLVPVVLDCEFDFAAPITPVRFVVNHARRDRRNAAFYSYSPAQMSVWAEGA